MMDSSRCPFTFMKFYKPLQVQNSCWKIHIIPSSSELLHTQSHGQFCYFVGETTRDNS